MTMDIDQANRTAVERMTSARPMLTGLARARDVIPACATTCCCTPVRRSSGSGCPGRCAAP